ncbi:hypothetical protein J2755_000182 [Methanohalophilus levihalophilus]|uniref:amidohydrolase family protein n=1 Tax=Methanohalophilus levihalophilus TaxID=1431282 RepID=UPI001AEB7289|nr:amidohydrolase family protein [Methanohalophilus levihalophilus]MBP2029262.1 hypothetical protein [Methanohalophilus levihalophilus]
MKIRINDAHCHYGTNSMLMTMALRPTKKFSNDFGELEGIMESNNVENCVLFSQPEPANTFGHIWRGLYYHLWNVSTDSQEPYFGWRINYTKANEKISKIKDKHVNFIPFLSASDGIEEIEKYVDERGNSPRGIKYYGIYGDIPNLNILQYLNEHEMSMVLHLPMKCRKCPQKLLDTVGRYPDLKFQLAHMGDGIPEILSSLWEFDNLYLDTAMITNEAYQNLYRKQGTTMEEMIQNAPESKILFGSDEPWGSLGEQAKSIVDLQFSGILSARDVDNILYQNARTVWAL